MVWQEWHRAAVALAVPQVGGMCSAFVSGSPKGVNRVWWQSINKPWFTPPDRLIGIVWPCLYAGMGYASYLVYRDGNGFDGAARWPLTVYGASLALNFVWTPIFFGAHNLGLATVTACALSAVCGECVRQFRDINVTAGWLMVPTTLWCTFASFLTYNLYTMNRKSNK